MAIEKNQEFLLAFGNRVKELRLAKGFSLRALADTLNIDKNQLIRIEGAKINTSILMAYAIAHALEVSLPELVTVEFD